MMNILKIILFIGLFNQFNICYSQTWSDPINISNLPGLNDQPDLCIDKNGTLHCVFVHKLASNWRKIYYTKSINDGEIWTTPEDISQNPDTTLYNPHIVVDSSNNLYVTYDYNVGDPAAIQVKLKSFDGIQWSVPFTVSDGIYSCYRNKLIIDKNDRLYVFWGYSEHWTNYRYYENGQWSDVFSLYPEQGTMETMSVVVDNENNLHCIGWGYSNGGPYAIYYSYIYDDFWTDWTIISPPTDFGAVGGGDIDLNNDELPAITYRQKTYGTGQNNDSKMYTYFDGTDWSEPELVVNDPYEQQIAIDTYNQIHIIDYEKLEIGTKLVHYQKINDLWQGYIVDYANNLTNFLDLTEKNEKLYLVYNKSDVPSNANVYITKFNIITGIDSNTSKVFDEFKIFPNPFITETIIEFRTSKEEFINISIYALDGKHIVTIDERKFSTRIYKYNWNGKDKNGKEVNSGTYLIRLQAGRQIITKPVEKMK
jgi:hypothetical protein